MADYNTWETVKATILRETDCEDEDFVTATELMEYANEAIDEIEKKIHDIGEDYFLQRSTLTLVNGTEEYSLPSDIYAHKIREIIYRNGSIVYPMKRIRDWKKFEEYEAQKATAGGTIEYAYFLLHGTAGSPKILLTPTPTESGAYPRIWYLRNANKITSTADTIDIPEVLNYIKAYVKMKILWKERSPAYQTAKDDSDAKLESTLESLATKVPDGDNEVEPNYSAYYEHT